MVQYKAAENKEQPFLLSPHLLQTKIHLQGTLKVRTTTTDSQHTCRDGYLMFGHTLYSAQLLMTRKLTRAPVFLSADVSKWMEDCNYVTELQPMQLMNQLKNIIKKYSLIL